MRARPRDGRSRCVTSEEGFHVGAVEADRAGGKGDLGHGAFGDVTVECAGGDPEQLGSLFALE